MSEYSESTSHPEEEPGLDWMLQSHPAERGERKQRYVVLYSCCCCCCCCLHTIGGAIGAVAAGNFQADAEQTGDSSAPSSQWLYWSSFVLTALAGIFLMAAFQSAQPYGRRHLESAPIIIGLTVILFGPLWQLGASAVTAIRLSFRTHLPSREKYWKQLGRITIMAVTGSVLGGLVMLAVLLVFIA